MTQRRFVVTFEECKTEGQKLTKFGRELNERFISEFPAVKESDGKLFIRISHLKSVNNMRVVWKVSYLEGKFQEGILVPI